MVRTSSFCVFAWAILLLSALNAAAAGPRDAQWRQVQAAIDEGLPKTAIERLEPIIAGAMQDKRYAEAVKAIGRKIALEGDIEGNKPEEKITRLQTEFAQAPPEMAPLLNAILANWYWEYFAQNNWRILERTQTGQPPGEDFTTWDLPRLFAEIDRQFTRGLAAEKQLQETPITAFDELLEKGEVPDKYRPTLFDFLAYNALDFYTAGEQAGATAEDEFELSADSPIFAPIDEFLNWTVEPPATSSPTVQAIRLYQKLLTFHRADQDPAALLDADLDRLSFGYSAAVGAEKNARYKAALKRFIDRWGDHELAAQALAAWATVLYQEGDAVQAHQLAERGVKTWPQTIGERMCRNLLKTIEAKSSSITTERVWNAARPTIDVRYTNLTKVYFRLVAEDWLRVSTSPNYQPQNWDQDRRRALLRKRPVRTWSADLPATADYKERVKKLPIPDDLRPGYYYLISSHNPDFDNNERCFTDVWISDLALVPRTGERSGRLEGLVLDARSGEPLADAQVRGWWWKGDKRIEVKPTKTDANGLFRLAGPHGQNFMLHVQHAGQQLATGNEVFLPPPPLPSVPIPSTFFFTDRALYRPGQTIQYKGLCVQADRAAGKYQVLADQHLTVGLFDANNQEIARQSQRTNAYGSFSGSLTAPRDHLLGEMVLRVVGGPLGATAFNVEEYKRPKFQVTLEPPQAGGKLHAQVRLTGTAAAYTGAVIGGAKVQYRVVREVRFPVWSHWYAGGSQPQFDSQEIAHGSASTAADGSFAIAFTARPSAAVSPDEQPTFQFTVHADVTDLAGETRTAERTINLGYTALQASLKADEWQTSAEPVEITIRTETLDGRGQPAEGTLRVYRLQQPEQVVRAKLYHVLLGSDTAESGIDPSKPDSWPLGEAVYDQGFTTGADGRAKAAVRLEPGVYRAVLETQDRFGQPVKARLPLQVLEPKADELKVKIPHLLVAPKWSLEPGSEFMAVWGSGYDRARAFVEIEQQGKILQSYWTEPGKTQVQIKYPVTESLRGGFSFRVTMVRENRAYFTSQVVTVPWSNKDLTIHWEHFVSKLGPGQRETWTAVVTGPDAQRAAAEVVATLYDASLDAYLHHLWPQQLGVFRQESPTTGLHIVNTSTSLINCYGSWPLDIGDVGMTYRAFPPDIVCDFAWNRRFGIRHGGTENVLFGYGGGMGGFFGGGMGGMGGLGGMGVGTLNGMALAEGAPAAEGAAPAERLAMNPSNPTAARDPGELSRVDGRGQQSAATPDLSKVSPRKNLTETAFFFPQLRCGDDGVVKLEFTMPEALTEWKFMAFAHDQDLRHGYLQDTAITAKDLMIEPNPPRFVREGDIIEFTVKVSNQSAARQTGRVRLTLANARTLQSVDAALGNTKAEAPFDIPAHESRSYAWRLQIPDGMEFLTYKAVGQCSPQAPPADAKDGTRSVHATLSDGEEGYLPVLSRRILVTESLPLPIRGAATRQFDFAKLRESGQSDSLQHQSLTVQMVSNPAWYAVLALPYLMEFPHECTEQTFNRLYANSLAQHVASSDPKIRHVFDQWKGTPTLASPLEANADLKALLLEETPWVRQSRAESQARQNVGVLFDHNRLRSETERCLKKLTDLQRQDGAWPWFPGGPANDYITLYIVTGFGRLRHLSDLLDVSCTLPALERLDGWIDATYRRILKSGQQDKNHLNPTIALYLYGRSFFLDDQPIAPDHADAVNYFMKQAHQHWRKLDCRQSQAHLAIALKRNSDPVTARAILRSVKEHAVSSEELGMYWRDAEDSWWWYRAPIETQALMIEALDEVLDDAEAVEACKVWLLKQKQTQDWKTTKATADAVYALLLRGPNQLASDALAEVSLGGIAIKPEKVEAGTGFYEHRLVRGEIKPELGRITVKRTDNGVAWGSVHWEYLEDMAKVTPYAGTPLQLKKALYTKENTKQGPTLQPVRGPLAVGDELVVRIELRVDRDMEFVHLKDQRGSGTEPVNVLSQYKFQDGLTYYESTHDTASHFFIDYLPKGTYVFEYSTRVVHKGRYQAGIAEIQCMYAPEFNSHSESLPLEVK